MMVVVGMAALGNACSVTTRRHERPLADAARMFKTSEDDVASKIREIREKLFAAREHRVKPGRDEKVLVAWNAMMIGAFAEGYRALHERRYLEAAERAADFMMTTMWDGRALKRSFKDSVARHNAYLEDYAQLTGAMLDVDEASLDAKYLAHARTLADVILERFIDKEKGGFFFTSDDHEALIMRSKAAFDGSTPSGNSAATMALLLVLVFSVKLGWLPSSGSDGIANAILPIVT